MFSSTPPKLFFAAAIFLSICFSASCSFWRSATGENSNANNQPQFTASQIPSDIPFATKEPEVFQTEIVTTNFLNGEKIERKTFLARNGAKRLSVFAAGEKSEISLLQIEEGKIQIFFPARKIYKETFVNQMMRAASAAGENLNDFLTAEWLSAKMQATFENNGSENGLSKFLVRLNNSDAAEILIYVDENLKIPVRQEFFRRGDGGGGGSGKQRALVYSVELKNFQTRAEEKLFEPPKDFRKVAPEEFDKIVWQAKE